MEYIAWIFMDLGSDFWEDPDGKRGQVRWDIVTDKSKAQEKAAGYGFNPEYLIDTSNDFTKRMVAVYGDVRNLNTFVPDGIKKQIKELEELIVKLGGSITLVRPEKTMSDVAGYRDLKSHLKDCLEAFCLWGKLNDFAKAEVDRFIEARRNPPKLSGCMVGFFSGGKSGCGCGCGSGCNCGSSCSCGQV